MKDIWLSPRADRDLNELWAYLQESVGEAAADAWVETLTERLHLLRNTPRMGVVRPDLGPGRRSFPFGDFVVIYRVGPATIDVLRVYHGAREISASDI